MSYGDFDLSIQGAGPVYLLLATRGSLTWRFSSRGRTIQAMGESWTSSPVEVGQLIQVADMLQSVLKLTWPIGDEFAREYLGYMPELVTAITLFRGHDSDTEYLPVWKGRISGAKIRKETDLVMECEPIFASMRRPGLRARYQKPCRHTIYQRGCYLTRADWLQLGDVTLLDKVTVTVPDAAALDDGYLNGGMLVVSTGESRMITSHVGQALVLNRPMRSLRQLLDNSGTDVPVELYPGCDQSRLRCRTIFDNLDNHGGWLLPKKNPFDGTSIV